jgi:hypothetical protein
MQRASAEDAANGDLRKFQIQENQLDLANPSPHLVIKFKSNKRDANHYKFVD